MLTASLVAFVSTALLIRWLNPLAFRIGLVDRPDARKCHPADTPLVGGLAMFSGFLLAVLTLDVALGPFKPLFMALAILVVVGVLDDFQSQSPYAHFLAQIIAALLMVFWGSVQLQDLGYIGPAGGLALLGAASIPLTVFASVGVINAINMSDGLDGLAASYAIVAVSSLLWISRDAQLLTAPPLLFLLLCVLLAFLLFNLRLPGRRSASTFMGDAGSMWIGFSLAWFFISLSQGTDRIMAPVTALWIFALPLMDTVASLLRRPLCGRSPFKPDREHLHHQLQDAGMGVAQVHGLLFITALGFAAVGLLGHHREVPEAFMFYAFLAVFFLYFLVSLRTWRVQAESANNE